MHNTAAEATYPQWWKLTRVREPPLGLMNVSDLRLSVVVCPPRFLKPNRIDLMRMMILAETEEDRQKALDKLFVFQKEDLAGRPCGVWGLF